VSILIKKVQLNFKTVDILIKGNRIVKIAENIEGKVDQEIDGKNKAALPTFHNVHTHAAMTLLRGYADDLPLHTWLEQYIWPFEQKLTFEDVYIGSKLACLEMIKSGTTFFCDMYWHPLATKQAVEEMGIRAALSTVFVDFNDNKKAKHFKERTERFFAENQDSERVFFILGPHAIYTVSRESLLWLKDFAQARDLFIHIHLAETKKELEDCRKTYGLTPVRYLDSLGFLGPKVVVAHSIWVDEEEMEILARREVKVVHVPSSNIKLASGLFPYAPMKEKGVFLSLGTDGCASNNNLDMFEEMMVASFNAKIYAQSPSSLPAEEAFALATKQGAWAFGLDSGEIKEGKLADLMLVNLNHYLLVPNHNLISNLVYSANPACLDTVICDGKVLMEKGKVEGEEDIIEEARECVQRILERVRKG